MWTLVAQGSMRQALVPRDASVFRAVIIAAPASTLRPAKSVVMATICMKGSASLVVLQGPMRMVKIAAPGESVWIVRKTVWDAQMQRHACSVATASIFTPMPASIVVLQVILQRGVVVELWGECAYHASPDAIRAATQTLAPDVVQGCIC